MNKFLHFLLLFCLAFAAKGQLKDSLNSPNVSYHFNHHQLVAPTVMMLGGTGVLLTEKRKNLVTQNQNFLAFGGYFEDYAQFAPHAAAYAFEMGGLKPRTDFGNRNAILVKGEALTFISLLGLKHAFKQPRPDGSNTFGFPSGHTANAFAGATFLTLEYGQRYRWVPYVAYGTAAGVGALRIAHHKHYWSDVLFGAGLGILSMKVVYWTHQYKWGKKTANTEVFSIIYNQQKINSVK